MRFDRLLPWLTLMMLVVPGCYPKISTGPQGDAARRVEVQEVQESAVSETLSLIGSVEPWQEAVLYFEVTGVVGEVFVEEGALIEEAGTAIARLVLDDFELALSRARAELDAARARLDLLLAGTRKEDLEAARADHARAKARAVYWSHESSRVSALYLKQVVALSEFEQVQREQEAAYQEQLATKARLDRAIAGPRKENIEAARAELTARTEAAALVKRQLDKATLRAPFAGRVEKRLVDVGAYINVFPTGGVPVVHLVDLSKVDAVIAVPEALRSRLEGKSYVEIRSAADPQVRGRAEVIALGKVADAASGTYQLRARIANTDGRFTGRMVVIATTTSEKSRSAIRIPLSALCRAYGQPPYVLLVEPKTKRVAARQVQLGPIAADRVEVTGGLSAGDLVIVRGHHRVVAGDRVEYGPAAAAPVLPGHGTPSQRPVAPGRSGK